MKLLNTVELLQDAYKKGYAVPAINVDTTDSVIALLEKFQELKAPVIIQIAPIQAHTRKISYKSLINSIVALGEDYDVTCAIHLDHGDDIEDVKVACESGFTSVMYDGSHKPFATNKANTSEIRSYTNGIGLEGELGIVGGNEGEESEDSVVADELYTNVQQAIEFVGETHVDFFAVAIGNAHGTYSREPKLNFQRLEELRNALDMPLVLHGASGLPSEDIKKAIQLGVSKINFFTDVDYAFSSGVKQSMDETPKGYGFKFYADGREEMKNKLEDIIEMCNCRGMLL
ncbi:MAG: class II fructose-bisphosphate aldolase [Eubacteriales bacterium]